MDKDATSHALNEVKAISVGLFDLMARVQRLAEFLAYETGKRPAEILYNPESAITRPAHLKLPKHNGKGGGTDRGKTNCQTAELN